MKCFECKFASEVCHSCLTPRITCEKRRSGRFNKHLSAYWDRDCNSFEKAELFYEVGVDSNSHKVLHIGRQIDMRSTFYQPYEVTRQTVLKSLAVKGEG